MSHWNKKQYSPKKEKKALTIEDIKEDLYLSKFAIRVFFMGYAIDSQFKMDNFQTGDLNKAKKLFDELGLISTSYYSDLKELDRECIYLSNPNFDKIDKQNPICYVSNQYFNSIGGNLIVELSDKWQSNAGVMDLVNNLQKKKDSFKILRLEKYKQEKTLLMREVRMPGTTYHKPTIKKREMDIAFLDARSELLHEGKITAKNELDEQLLQLQNTKILQIEHIKSNDSTALVVINKNTDLIEVEYKNNLLTVKDNYDNNKKFKNINSSDNTMDETRTVNIAALFQDVVKVPKNDIPQQLTDDPVKKQTKKQEYEERDEAEIDCVLFKDRSIENKCLGHNNAEKFLEELEEFVE